jgi:DNA replication protein DnaC
MARRIKGACFPMVKELADFDFSCISSPNKQRVLELARGSYIHKAEPIILVGNPGLGKTHAATGLALAACRQGHKVRFYNAAGLVNDMIAAQDEHLLPKFLARALNHHLFVIDELGFIPFSPVGAQLMFQFCSTLYERVAVIVTIMWNVLRSQVQDQFRPHCRNLLPYGLCPAFDRHPVSSSTT